MAVLVAAVLVLTVPVLLVAVSGGIRRIVGVGAPAVGRGFAGRAGGALRRGPVIAGIAVPALGQAVVGLLDAQASSHASASGGRREAGIVKQRDG